MENECSKENMSNILFQLHKRSGYGGGGTILKNDARHFVSTLISLKLVTCHKTRY